jgi:hypothetical protein
MRSVMASNDRAPAALGATGTSACPLVPTALWRNARVYPLALVDMLGDPPGGHQAASLFQGHRAIAVDLELEHIGPTAAGAKP